MKQLKHKKLLVTIIGITAVTVMILYLWVGAFVLQVFPRNDPQNPGSISNSQKFRGELNATHEHDTLAQINEKEVPTPVSNHTAPNTEQPGSRSKNQESHNEKPSKGKRHGLLQFLGAD